MGSLLVQGCQNMLSVRLSEYADIILQTVRGLISVDSLILWFSKEEVFRSFMLTEILYNEESLNGVVRKILNKHMTDQTSQIF